MTQASETIPAGGTAIRRPAHATASAVRGGPAAGTALRVAAGRADALALGVFGILAAIALWLRFVYDNWITEFDLFTMFIPWFGYIGDRLREGDIPAWSPYYFSGAPTVGNPSGGWMYLLVMLLYPLFHIVTATKLLLLCHVYISGAATYAFSRRIGFGPAAALTSAMIFSLGEIIYGGTNFRTIGVQTSTWLVVGLLGAEMAVRARRSSAMLGWTALIGVAVSQMFVAWPGQGVIYGSIWIGGWMLYRTLVDSDGAPPRLGDRIWGLALNGFAIAFFTLAFGAAGILPMLDYIAESTVPNGDYSNVVGGDYAGITHELLPFISTLVSGSVNFDFTVPSESLGASVMVLAIFGVIFGRRSYGVPFFATMFVLACSLMITNSPTLWLFERLPMIGHIHEHRPSGIAWLFAIGPAMLAGAAIQKLRDRDRRNVSPTTMLVMLSVLMVAFATMSARYWWVGWWPVLTGVAAVLVYALPSITLPAAWARWQPRLPNIATALLIGILFLYPNGVDLFHTVRHPETIVGGWTDSPGKEPESTEVMNRVFARTEPGTAAAFLQRQRDTQPPFRYTGYASQGREDPAWTGQDKEGHKSGYSWRRMEQGVVGILVNGRSMRLRLEQTSGYNPVQLRYYGEYMDVMNGKRQDYHWLDTFAPALDGSQLLDMLNVRYILVDRSIPSDRADFEAISRTHEDVYRDRSVIVFENESAFPRAWIVHQVRDNRNGGGMRLLASGRADGHEVAFVNGPIPSTSQPPDGGAGEGVVFLQSEPETIVMSATARADGLMVVSEPYASGWNAYVDGRKVEILRTNHALRGVPIPAGDHLVVMKYEPKSLRIGLWTTGLTSIAMLGVWAWALVDWRRTRRRGYAPALAVTPENRRQDDGSGASGRATRAARPETP